MCVGKCVLKEERRKGLDKKRRDLRMFPECFRRKFLIIRA